MFRLASFLSDTIWAKERSWSTFIRFGRPRPWEWLPQLKLKKRRMDSVCAREAGPSQAQWSTLLRRCAQCHFTLDTFTHSIGAGRSTAMAERSGRE